MATLFFTSTGRRFPLFLNISFLFLVSLYVTTHPQTTYRHGDRRHSSTGRPLRSTPSYSLDDSGGNYCSSLHKFTDYTQRCSYVTSEAQCKPEGYINYLQLFYCIYGRYPVFGCVALILWLVLLFYLLGNTAANYFCSSLEGLSRVLNLPPTIAGVTLLSLGNGAPDVFSSIVSFMGTSTGDVGLNSILGGAFFVSSVVTGIVSICVRSRKISVEKPSFIRDVCFFLITLSALTLIIAVGKINLWGAIAFTSIYFVYIFFSSTAHFCERRVEEGGLSDTGTLLPLNTTAFSQEAEKSETLDAPLLTGAESADDSLSAIQSVQNDCRNLNTGGCFGFSQSATYYFIRKVISFLELPLYLMRRLTIPDVLEERWSKPFAVTSVTFAPLLLGALWNSKRGDMTPNSGLTVYLIALLTGVVFGITVLLTTENSAPPRRLLFPWLTGGFLMSVVWTYITAEELVSLLVSLGVILGISPSILGLTLLAWGNSIGDLIANVLMAVNSTGPYGAQVAISGCYAGPIFNTLVGLGVPLVLCSWSEYPSSYVIPGDSSLYQTIGFLVGGLLWAIVILPGRGMRLDRVFGGGLLTIYACFLCLRIAQSLGVVPLHGFWVSSSPSPAKS